MWLLIQNLNSLFGNVTGRKFGIIYLQDRNFLPPLSSPPRVIRHTGELMDEAVKEIIKWIDFNKEVLLSVWESSVNE